MTTRVDIAGRVRAELNDSGPTLTWADSLLYGWLGEGLQQMAVDLPLLKSAALTVLPGTRQFSLFGLGVGPRGVRSVEYPDGNLLPRGNTRAQNNGVLTTSQPFDNCWELVRTPGDGINLWLRYPPDGSQSYLTVWYYALYSVPANDAAALDIAGFDENLLVWFICSRALAWLEAQRGKRGAASAAGRTTPASYYAGLYGAGIITRRKNRPVQTEVLQSEV